MKGFDWMFKTRHTLSELLAVAVCYFFALLLPSYLGLDKNTSLVLIIGLLFLMRIIEWPLAKLLGIKDKKMKFRYYFYMFLIVPFLVIGFRIYLV